MTKLRALLWSPWMILPLLAQEPPELSTPAPLPPIDTITPVPAPEIPLGSSAEMLPGWPETLKLTQQGEGIEGNFNTHILIHGPLKIEGDNGLEIFADQLLWEFSKERVTFTGNVSIYQGNLLQKGDRAVYYYQTKYLDTSGMRASVDPILLESGKFTMEMVGDKPVFTGENAGITTHDVEHPDFWVRSSKTTIYPEEKVTFRNLRLYAGDVPVFWLPYLSQPLNAELGYHFLPGARSNWGPYLLNRYGIMLGGTLNEETGERDGAWLLSQWRFDLLSSRGIGTGLNLRDTRGEQNSNLTGLGFYYLNDMNPDRSRSGVSRDGVNEDRYSIELKDRRFFDFEQGATWYLDANLSYLSDRYYLEDFDPTRYRYDPSPDNTLGLFRRDDKTLLSLLGRFRLNDFYRADSRLPELSLDQARGPLLGSQILHEGKTSFGVIRTDAADFMRQTVIDPLLDLPRGDRRAASLLNQLSGYERLLAERILSLPPGDPRIESLRAQLLDTGYTRFHTYQDFSLPMMLGNWLSLTPQLGAGYTRYDSVDGPSSSLDTPIFHAGAEASMKFSKDLGAIENPRWGLNGLLHVVQPYANWSLVSTDEQDWTTPRVDRLTFTTRPRTLDPARFTATDDMGNWNIVRLGTRNRLLTKRDGQSHEWLYLNTYMDALAENPENDNRFSNLYNDVRWAPLPWLEVDFETQFPIVDGGSGFHEFASQFRFLPTPDLEFSIGYRLLSNHPVLVDSSRIDLRAYARLSENWGIGMRQIFEADDRTLELQQYTIHRDLGSWVAGMGLTLRDNRLEKEYGVIFSLTMKDFPSVSLPFKIDAD